MCISSPSSHKLYKSYKNKQNKPKNYCVFPSGWDMVMIPTLECRLQWTKYSLRFCRKFTTATHSWLQLMASVPSLTSFDFSFQWVFQFELLCDPALNLHSHIHHTNSDLRKYHPNYFKYQPVIFSVSKIFPLKNSAYKWFSDNYLWKYYSYIYSLAY